MGKRKRNNKNTRWRMVSIEEKRRKDRESFPTCLSLSLSTLFLYSLLLCLQLFLAYSRGMRDRFFPVIFLFYLLAFHGIFRCLLYLGIFHSISLLILVSPTITYPEGRMGYLNTFSGKSRSIVLVSEPCIYKVHPFYVYLPALDREAI